MNNNDNFFRPNIDRRAKQAATNNNKPQTINTSSHPSQTNVSFSRNSRSRQSSPKRTSSTSVKNRTYISSSSGTQKQTSNNRGYYSSKNYRRSTNGQTTKWVIFGIALIIIIIIVVVLLKSCISSNNNKMEPSSIINDVSTNDNQNNNANRSSLNEVTTKQNATLPAETSSIFDKKSISSNTNTANDNSSLDKTSYDFISTVTSYNYENYEEWSDLSIAGVNYNKGISIGRTGSYSGNGYAKYTLNSKYSTLSFDVGNIDNRGVAEDQVIYIYLDDKCNTTIQLKPGELPEHYIIDLNGVDELQIIGSEWAGDYGIINMQITLAEYTEKETDKSKKEHNLLTECSPYRTEGYDEWSNESIMGVKHAYGISVGGTGNRSGEGYALYNLDGKYTALYFDLGNIDSRGVATEQRYEIYLDGQMKWSHNLDPEEEPTHHKIDLTGVKQLKIVGSEWAGDYGIFDLFIVK